MWRLFSKSAPNLPSWRLLSTERSSPHVSNLSLPLYQFRPPFRRDGLESWFCFLDFGAMSVFPSRYSQFILCIRLQSEYWFVPIRQADDRTSEDTGSLPSIWHFFCWLCAPTLDILCLKSHETGLYTFLYIFVPSFATCLIIGREIILAPKLLKFAPLLFLIHRLCYISTPPQRSKVHHWMWFGMLWAFHCDCEVGTF